MYTVRKGLLVILTICLFIPFSQANDPVYRVDGLPEDLHYTKGSSYEIVLTASNYSEISSVDIAVTNGTLSETNEFEPDVHQLNFSESSEGWTFHWQAPSESFELGEGEAELAVTFFNLDGDIWSSYNSVIKPPEIEAHAEPNVPDWASSMAWIGASITVLLTVLGALVLRRDRLT